MREWNEESAGHNADNDKNKCGAELIERAGNPINQEQIYGEGDKHGGGSELKVREILEVRDNRECEHTGRNGDADGDGIFDDVAGEAVFDALGVVFQGKNKTGKTDTGEVK